MLHEIERCIELTVNACRMPTTEQETGGEKITKGESASRSNVSIVSSDYGDSRIPPELRAALPNVVWSRQEDLSDDKVGVPYQVELYLLEYLPVAIICKYQR